MTADQRCRVTALTEHDIENLVHWAYAAELQAVVGVMITKISVCWFVLRLLGRTNRWMRLVIWACMVVSFAMALMYVLSQAFVCIPLEAYWNTRVSGRCISKQTISDILLPNNSESANMLDLNKCYEEKENAACANEYSHERRH